MRMERVAKTPLDKSEVSKLGKLGWEIGLGWERVEDENILFTTMTNRTRQICQVALKY
jgi:hypothetical protein